MASYKTDKIYIASHSLRPLSALYISEWDVIDKGFHLATNFTPLPPKASFYSSSICTGVTLTRETPQAITYKRDN